MCAWVFSGGVYIMNVSPPGGGRGPSGSRQAVDATVELSVERRAQLAVFIVAPSVTPSQLKHPSVSDGHAKGPRGVLKPSPQDNVPPPSPKINSYQVFPTVNWRSNLTGSGLMIFEVVFCGCWGV